MLLNSLSPSACAHGTMRGFVRDDGKASENIEMKSTEEKVTDETVPESKKPSKDSPFRWAGFSVFMIVTVPMLLAVIVMVAFP